MNAGARLFATLALTAFTVAAQRPAFIRLEIAAADSSGQPVADLRPNEIRILDDGVPQSIAFFHRHSDLTAWQSAPLAHGQFSNRFAARPVTVVVLNCAAPSVQKLQYNQTLSALHRFGSTEDLYFYLLTGANAVMPIRGLPESEKEAVAQNRPQPAPPPFERLWDIAHTPVPHEETGAFDSSLAGRYAVLESLASKMALLPGAKTLVWIGAPPRLIPRDHNTPMPPGEAQAAETALHLLSLFDQASIAIYTVQTTQPYQPGDIDNGAPMLGFNPDFASLTGGLTYQDEIVKAVGDAVAATHEGYRVLYPAPRDSRKAYRKLKVSCTRRGVRLITKQAYYFETVVDVTDTVARELADTTVAALRDAPDIGLRVTLSHPAANPTVLHVTTRVDVNDLLLLPDSGSFRGNFSLQFIGYTEDGRKITLADSMRLGLRLAPSDRDAALKNGLSFPDDLAPDQTVKKLRVIVTDELGGSVGSLTIPLEGTNNLPPASSAPEAAASPSPSTTALNRVSEFVRSAIAQLPRYTCSATVNRIYLRQTRSVGRTCDDIIAARRKFGGANLKATATDRLRFDVEIADRGYEMFSWPGASRIDSEKIENFSDGGPLGTGPFGPFLIDIFTNSKTRFDFRGEETLGGRKLLAWRFRVPASASHYEVGVIPSVASASPVLHVVPYEGRFWIDPSIRQLARLEVSTTALRPETQSCELDTVVDLQKVKIGEGEYLIPRQSVMHVIGKYGEDSESTTAYSACREFRGDSVLRLDASSTELPAAGPQLASFKIEPLPPGLPVRLAFETQIDTDTSAAGDRLVAAVARNVTDPVSKQTLLPAGTRLTGRIVHMEHHLEGREYFIVSIAFDSPHLVLDHARQVLSPSEPTPCWDSVDRIESKGQLNEGSTFILPSHGGRFVAPRGCQSSWITAR